MEDLWSVRDTPRYVPLEEVEKLGDTLNCWSEPPAGSFEVRTVSYLKDRQKLPSKEAVYRGVGMNVFKRASSMVPATRTVEHLKRYLKSQIPPGDTERNNNNNNNIPEFLVVCWQFHNFFRTEYWCAVQLFRLREDVADDVVFRTLERFMQASDKEKCEKLKFMAHIKEANPALKRSVNLLGGERPAIIGKKLTTAFTVGDGFLEIDMDVGSSNIASSLNGVVSRASKALVVDKCWLIEGQADDELPERVLCACEWYHCGLDDISIEIDKKGRLKNGERKPPQANGNSSKIEKVEVTIADVNESPSDETAEIESNISDLTYTKAEEDDDQDGEDNYEDGYFDTFTTVNDKDFIPEDAKPYKFKKEELTKLQEISRIFSSMDICLEPIQGKHEGYLEMKPYEHGKHRWHRRYFTLSWRNDKPPVLTYKREKDAFNHSLEMSSEYRIESRNTFFGGTCAFALIEDSIEGPQTKVLLRAKNEDELKEWLTNFIAAFTAKERYMNGQAEEAEDHAGKLDPNLHRITNSVKSHRKRRDSVKAVLTFEWLRKTIASGQ